MVNVKDAVSGTALTPGNSEVLAKNIEQVAAMVIKGATVAAAEPKKTESKNSVILDMPSDASGDDFLAALMVMQNKLSKEKMLATREDIKDSTVRSDAEHKKNLEKMKESQEKAKEAEKSGMLQKVFGWIATAVSVIVAAVVTIGTLGAGAGVGAMICAGVALATTLASTAIQAANDLNP